jgi:hypothetical protein
MNINDFFIQIRASVANQDTKNLNGLVLTKPEYFN